MVSFSHLPEPHGPPFCPPPHSPSLVPGLDAAELRVLRAAHPRQRPAAGGEALEADRKRRRVGGTGGPGSLLGRQVLVNFKAVEVGVPNFQRNPYGGE